MSVRALRRGTMAGRAAAGAGGANVAYLSLPGLAGNYLTTPDSVANSFSGDMDIRAKIAPVDWTPASVNQIVGKWPTTGNRSYRMQLNSTGLYGAFSPNGSSVQTTLNIPTGFTDGAVGWVRLTRVAATGAWAQYKSSDGASWTQLNTGSSSTGSVFDTSVPLSIGGYSDDGANPFNGKIYYLELRNGIDGTVIASFDPTAVTKLGTRDPSSLVSSTGETWTINGPAWDWVEVA